MINKYKLRKLKSIRIRRKIKNFKLDRLVVHKTSRHIYAQIFSKEGNIIKAYASTIESDILKYLKEKNIYTGNKVSASIIGKIISERAINKKIYKVFFDRSRFIFHGRLKSLAESARENGLIF